MATNNSINNRITSGNFTVTAGNLICGQNITLPSTVSTGTTGVVKVNGNIWMHTYCETNANQGNIGIGVNCTRNSYYGGAGWRGYVAIGTNCLRYAAQDTGSLGAGVAIGHTVDTGSHPNHIYNVDIGYQCCRVANQNSDFGVIIGAKAFYSGAQIYQEVAIGSQTIYQQASCGYGAYLGYKAGYNLATAGKFSNIFIGASVLGTNGDEHIIRIGNHKATSPGTSEQNLCYIAGIYGGTLGATCGLALVDSDSQIGAPTATANKALIGGTKPSFDATVTLTDLYATTFDTNVAAAAVTLSGTTLAADGTDSDISITITPKGTGTISSVATYNKDVSALTIRNLQVDSNGLIGYDSSSSRYKENIENMSGIESIFRRLRPVTFSYKKDDKKRIQYGLIAEEVEKVAPELITRDSDGTPASVNYSKLLPMLLEEIKRLSTKIKMLEGC